MDMQTLLFAPLGGTTSIQPFFRPLGKTKDKIPPGFTGEKQPMTQKDKNLNDRCKSSGAIDAKGQRLGGIL
ncbi:MAG: hypothetical protein RR403_01465 [Pseudoflavonifractor sp.]